MKLGQVKVYGAIYTWIARLEFLELLGSKYYFHVRMFRMKIWSPLVVYPKNGDSTQIQRYLNDYQG